MPVEIGEVEVVTRPPESGDAPGRTEAPAAGAAPAATEIERSLMLREARDLRLRAD